MLKARKGNSSYAKGSYAEVRNEKGSYVIRFVSKDSYADVRIGQGS